MAIRYLRELPQTGVKAKGGRGRQLLVSVLFDQIDVLELQEATVDLSAHAARYGMRAVLPAELRLPVDRGSHSHDRGPKDHAWSGRECLSSGHR